MTKPTPTATSPTTLPELPLQTDYPLASSSRSRPPARPDTLLPEYDATWPQPQTLALDPPWQVQKPRTKREKSPNVRSLLYPRQGCGDVSNGILSCAPTADTKVVQNHWTPFKWNTGNPAWNQEDNVDIYLFHADSGEQVEKWTLNKWQGTLPVQANDSLWDARGLQIQTGQNQSFSYYFVIVEQGQAIHQGEPTQATFTAIQTALPNSIIAQASQSSLSVVSASSVMTASASSVLAAQQTGNPDLQHGVLSDSNFPHWAIALLAVLGFLALVALLLLMYILIRNFRNRNRFGPGNRGSMGSASPIMEEASPTNATHTGHGSYIVGALPLGQGGARTSSIRFPGQGNDGASVVSGSDKAPFSGADAAIISDAFRLALRKPDFADRPAEEGESPDQLADAPKMTRKEELMRSELADEGRDIRSVSSERGVKVESVPGDHGDL